MGQINEQISETAFDPAIIKPLGGQPEHYRFTIDLGLVKLYQIKAHLSILIFDDISFHLKHFSFSFQMIIWLDWFEKWHIFDNKNKIIWF